MRHVIMRTTVATIQGPAADDDDGDDDGGDNARRRRHDDATTTRDDDGRDDARGRRRRRRRRRRDDARMWPAWYYLTRMVALRTRSKEFEVRAKVAREAPSDRNVEKPMVFEGFSLRALADFHNFWMRKSYVFIGFIEVVA